MSADWQGQQGCCRLRGTCYLPVAISLFFALSAPLSSTPQPPEASREVWGSNCVHLEPSCLPLSSFCLPMGSERHFNSPCGTSAFNFSILSSCFRPSILLLLAGLPPHTFLISSSITVLLFLSISSSSSPCFPL